MKSMWKKLFKRKDKKKAAQLEAQTAANVENVKEGESSVLKEENLNSNQIEMPIVNESEQNDLIQTENSIVNVNNLTENTEHVHNIEAIRIDECPEPESAKKGEVDLKIEPQAENDVVSTTTVDTETRLDNLVRSAMKEKEHVAVKKELMQKSVCNVIEAANEDEYGLQVYESTDSTDSEDEKSLEVVGDGAKDDASDKETSTSSSEEDESPPRIEEPDSGDDVDK